MYVRNCHAHIDLDKLSHASDALTTGFHDSLLVWKRLKMTSSFVWYVIHIRHTPKKKNESWKRSKRTVPTYHKSWQIGLSEYLWVPTYIPQGYVVHEAWRDLTRRNFKYVVIHAIYLLWLVVAGGRREHRHLLNIGYLGSTLAASILGWESAP